jgi:purine-binding chemotaxis protein CheW
VEKQSKVDPIPVLAFRLADQFYALPISCVVEVAAMVALTQLPDAPPVILGLANRHGEVLPILDLRIAFGLPAEPIGLSTLFIVCELDHLRAGFVIDEVFQVRYIAPEMLRDAHGAGRLVKQYASDGNEVYQVIQLRYLFEAHLSSNSG